ncbi:MAG: hypothetical protein MI864_21340, partial [Pseudomonadales bacterium]|nr:hypothetical protein [Pseudomonadales bacterium]
MGSQLARSGLTGIKRCIELLADKLGLCVIAKWRLDSLLLENRLRRILFEYEIDCVLDVGANVGQYRDFLRNRVGYQGPIISFEPDPENVARLKQLSAKDPKWIIQD